ncbi:MAG: CPBP family intramembrane metalloprotease [Geothrix sp.]|nr:CPBP family intramembrane metalloprotease [Geothrix sp.]
MHTQIEKQRFMAGREKHLLLVGLILALGFFSLPIGAWIDQFANLAHMVAYELIIWSWVALMLLYVGMVERKPLSSIGFRMPGVRDGVIGVLTGVLILVALGLIYYVLFPLLHWNEQQQINQVAVMPYWLSLLIVVRAAVSEEILFRGYAIERIQQLTGSRSIAGIVSCLVFTLDHVGFWGWHHVFIAGLAGAILTLLYLWRRNLWINMLAHFIVDGAAFLL